MVHPHIQHLGLADLYISPLEFDPGKPAGGFVDLELRKGESARVGATAIRFDDFDLQVEGNALAHMEAGEPVTIGARLAIEREDGATWSVRPLYRFRPSGEAESPPIAVPGGGTVFLTGINATARAVQLQVRGFGAATPEVPARLAVDVTRKPLIRLVWYGLYVVLGGGLLAAFARARTPIAPG
jgi:cytochrome c-type biogenesis protein CcmF